MVRFISFKHVRILRNKMKKILIISLFALIAGGCGNSATVQQTNTNTVSNSTTRSGEQLIVTSHTTEKPTANKPSGGSPMEKAVDVKDLTEKIEKADKDYKAKPNDAKAKEALATAYFGRAFVLTKAAQYKSALGDFRKGLKLNPDDKEAKEMHDQIVNIFQSMNRELPKEGEEPPPIEVK